MRQLAVTLIALTVVRIQTPAATLDWLFDVANTDNVAREQAQFLVWDGVPHSFSARFEKVNIVDKDWPFFLFHIVIASPGAEGERDRGSYLVCFRLTELYDGIPNSYRDSIRFRSADRTGDYDR